jgi:putative ABC transport system permease protein
MTWVSGWRLALRLAWREALRARGRSALVLVMVTFPVVAIVAADVAQATSSVSAAEGLNRRIGTSAARVMVLPQIDRVYQTADPDNGGIAADGGHRPEATLAQIEQALGGGSRPAIELRMDDVRIRSDLGLLQVRATGVDLRSPLAHGLFRLTSGRLPSGAHEVAINAALAEHGYAVGDTLTEAGGDTVEVVGTAESTQNRTQPMLVGDTDLLPSPGHGVPHDWLVGGNAVTWDQVRAANALGVVVLSREVIEHPPSLDQLPPQVRDAYSNNQSTIYTVLAVIGVMVLIEVVLLAGPAFAVGARRQSRNLALISANGGNPPQSRRVILGTAVVLGALAAVVGVALGILLGWALLPVLQGASDTYFGPFQIRWTHVVAIAAFGFVSALLAAVVPAWVASRQDVVAVLAGRRGDRAASRRSPFVGVLFLAVAVVLAVEGARRGAGSLLIAGAAVLAVFGMLFLVPVIVVAVARLGRRFPLPLRYAVRDAARHRTRTVPAIAAVAATVAGVVALSIANTSDQAQARADYTQELPKGDGYIAGVPAGAAGEVDQVVREQLPGVQVTDIMGDPDTNQMPMDFRVPGQPRFSSGYASRFGASVLVGPTALAFTDLRGDALARARSVLDHGGVVAFADQPVSAHRVRVTATSGPRRGQSITVPATYVDISRSGPGPALAVVSPQVTTRLQQPIRPVVIYLHGSISTAAEARASEALAGLSQDLNLYVERGYQVPNSEKIVLWILFGLAGVLMLGGTLTATFLALSDARPDLATLSAVGASPRMRRAVAAAFAVSVGFVGAAMGAAVGFIPGIAISYPLTRNYDGSGPSHYVSIPWLEIIGLVVALPIVTALVVGLLARSRLPMVARLD